MSPVSDPQIHRPNSVDQRGLPPLERGRPKRLAQYLRIRTLNVGSMTGGGRARADRDMNGHVGSGNDAISRIHGGNPCGNGDEDGEKGTDLGLSFDMVIGNTLFRKRNEHLISYKSNDGASQIDFLLYRRRNIREIKNCKVVPGDHVTEQNRLVVTDLTIDVSQKQKRKTTTQRRIKRFKLKENGFQQEFKA
ncbi:uncharacterized protein LOC119589586 [Penaeus monodon]|uniref:uncharacterized protein LOC119589586 n=1 Tax=Penaeus monodon TaxID=6687 RepID=UPI0018A735A9|nr:uncharacterized protein LOC119589586 [Penaeus monodon]